MNEFETWIKMHTLDMISKHIFFFVRIWKKISILMLLFASNFRTFFSSFKLLVVLLCYFFVIYFHLRFFESRKKFVFQRNSPKKKKNKTKGHLFGISEKKPKNKMDEYTHTHTLTAIMLLFFLTECLFVNITCKKRYWIIDEKKFSKFNSLILLLIFRCLE